MTPYIIFRQITVIGLGLIGSSLVRAVRQHKISETIIGCDMDAASLVFAIKENFIDIAEPSLQKSVVGSDLVIIATPPATLANIAKAIAPHLKSGAIVMDVASVKLPAIEAIAPHLPENVIFIPAHPIAGSEHSGVQSGRGDLFANKRVIITPPQPPSEVIFKKISEFWEKIGAKIEAMPPTLHDLIYAYVSHLPQLIAFCLQEPLGKFFTQIDNNQTYKTFLRITNSNPELWAEIFELNKINILGSLDRYIDVVSHVHNELKTAPEGEESRHDDQLAYTVLFPRIVASCLITTVMEAEKKAGLNFARYAGSGFADITTTAIIAPDSDMEKISTHHQIVGKILDKFLIKLKTFQNTLSSDLA